MHLQQSPLDKSCGLTCVLMLAMLADGLPRDQAVAVAWTARPKLKKLWAVAKAGYFRGTSPASLVRHLEAVCEGGQVNQLRGSHSELFALVAVEVERDNVVLLLIGETPKARLHWILVTGAEYVVQGAATAAKSRRDGVAALLGLDPESPPPVCSAFNWRMPRRKGNAERQATCSTTNGAEEYRELQRAVVLRRAD